MKIIFPGLALLAATASIACGDSAMTAPLARNPVIWADVPDAAMIRVGETYYMSSTTMHMCPGLPIMKSKDLATWETIGYAYDVLVDNPKMRLEDGENAYGAGSWASSLRFHEGTYYATTFSSTSGKTHIYTTRDIENGPWESFEFSPSLHDHSLWFDDDGRVYMIYAGGDLRLVELNPGARGIKPGTSETVIIPNASKIAGDNIMLPSEGSQLFKHEGRYYLFNITWPREDMRTVTIHRAESIHGPWEGRVALKDRGIAQGGIIDTPNGDWYAYLFRDFGSVGRTPYLVPVSWEDGWPVIGIDGKAPDTLPLPAPADPIAGIVASDEFDRSPGDADLPLAWQWNHLPDNDHWSLSERPGYLRLKSFRVDNHVLQARNMLTQRTFGPVSSARTKLDFQNMKDGDIAGFIALQRHYGFVGVERFGNTFRLLVEQSPEDEIERPYSILLPEGLSSIHLRIHCDFRELTDKANFFYSIDGNTWTQVGPPLQMRYTLPHFMGYRFGLFYFATRDTGGHVDFDHFRIQSH